MTEENMVMPVAPAYSNGGMGGLGYGGDFWLILILIFAFGGFGMGGWGGFGGYGNNLAVDGAAMYPWMNQAQITTNGFQNQALNTNVAGIQNAITSGFGDVQLGIAGINQNLCQTGNGITQAVNNGFSQAEIANNGRQMASMQQSYANQTANMQQAFAQQTAMNQGFNGVQSQLAQCCCDNRLSSEQTKALILSENCADRAALSDGIRDIITNQTANTQKILDTICQDKIDAKNEKIVELQNQVLMRDLAASQTAQTAQLVADNTAQTQYLVNRISPYPVPSYTVPNPYTPIYSA